ncbi:hypothetical protein ACLIYM_06795 [Streptomyces fenghuangensis]
MCAINAGGGGCPHPGSGGAPDAVGGLKLALVRVPERVEARGRNGDVTVEVPRAAYRVDAAADNGGTRVEVPRGGAGDPAVTARAANGDVTVRPVSRRDRS